MTKFINRLGKDDLLKKQHRQDHSNEDLSYITEMGPKIDIQDPLEVRDRAIYLSKEEQPKTKIEIVQEKSEELKDQIQNTNQYQKFVNIVLKEKVGDLRKVLDQQKRFSEELNCFQDTTKTRQELEKVNPKYITEADTKSLVSDLESEYSKMEAKLEYEKSKIEKIKSELDTKKQQIDELKEEMKFIVKKGIKAEVIDDPVLTLRQELKKLGIGDDSGKIAEALRLLSKKMNQNT